jgi:hypothetical protein
LAFAALVVGCTAAEHAPEGAVPDDALSELPVDHPPVTPAPSRPSGPVRVGVVQEQMDGGGYTYARMFTEEGEIWTAGPMAALSVGDSIALFDPVPMEGFHSNALDRTFDVLYFLGGYQVARTREIGAGHVVLEVLTSGGYSYVELQSDNASMWLATPETTVSEGDRIAWQGGSVMREFTSNTLNRTFDEILFVGSVEILN